MDDRGVQAAVSKRAVLGAALTGTIVLWASAFVVIRSAGRVFAPGHLALLRFLTASTVLAVYAAMRRIRVPGRRDLGWFFVCGFLGIAAYHTLLNFGEVAVPAGAASLLINSVPIFTALLAMALLKERLRPAAWGGILVSFLGIALIAASDRAGFQLEPRAVSIVVAAACGAGFVVMQKRFFAAYDALTFTCWSFFCGTLELLVFVPGFFGAVRGAPWRSVLEVMYLGVFPGALAYLLFAFATRQMKASSVTSFMYVVPVVAMVLAWPYLGELPAAMAVVGGGMAVAGVVVVNRLGTGRNGQ